MRNVFSDGQLIIVDTFDLDEAYGTEYKVDLLCYNKINQDGAVLTSVVHVTDVKYGNDTAPIIYNPKFLLSNIKIPDEFDSNYKWTEVTQFQSQYNFKKIDQASSMYNEMYDAEKIYALTMGNDETIYDGWYTVISRGVDEISDFSILSQYQWGYSNGTVYYALVDNPTTPDEISPIYDIKDQSHGVFNTLYADETMQEDFFILSHSLTMYTNLLNKTLEKEWYTQFTSIRPKIRTLETLLEQKKYEKAQYILQAMDYALITQLI